MQNLNTIPSAGKVSPIVQSSSDSRFSTAAQAEGYHLFARKTFDEKCPWTKQDIHTAQSTRSSNPYLTVLAVKPLALGDKPYSEAAHFGDWYVDFDSKPEVEPALRMGLMALDVLNQWGIPDDQIRIWLTGGKGLHIQIHPAVFGWESFDHNEYRVPAYKSFAFALDAELVKLESASSGIAPEKVSTHLDTSVYTGKSGRQWREPGVDRGNGQYKVPVTTQEFRDLLASGNVGADYVALCSSPRDEPERPAALRSAGAVGKFRQIWEDKQAVMKAQEDAERLSREELKKFLAEAYDDERYPAVIGMKVCQNIVAAALHKDPRTGKRVTKEGWEGWSEVLRALHYEGSLYDCLDEALCCAIDYSRAVEGFISTADVERRFLGFDDYEKRIKEGKPMTTAKTIFALVRGVQGYLDPNPDGKGCFKHQDNAVDVLNKMLGLDGVQLRTAVKEDIYSEAFNACEIAGYKELLAKVEEHLKKQQLLQAFKREVKQADLQNRGADEDETGPEKLLKYVKSRVQLVKDQYGGLRILVQSGPLKGSQALLQRKDAERLLASIWVNDPQTGGAGKAWPSRTWDGIREHLIAECHQSTVTIPVGHRYAPFFDSQLEGVGYVDLGWGCAAVEAGKLTILDAPPEGVYFERKPTDLPMPQFEPLRKDADCSELIARGVESLRKLTRFGDESQLMRMISILTYTICHDNGIPIVVVTGDAGSGKTTTSIALRTFIHNSSRSASSLPWHPNDFIAALAQDCLHVFDNIYNIAQEISEMLSQNATGTRFQVIDKRALNTDADMFQVRCGVAVWLTGIDSGIRKADLQSRAQFFKMQKLLGKAITDRELEEDLKEISGDIYHALLWIAATALEFRQGYKRDDDARKDGIRMFGYGLWHIAVCEVFGISKAKAAEMLTDSTRTEAVKALEAHAYLCHMFKITKPFIEVTSTELYETFKTIAIPQHQFTPKDFPDQQKFIRELGLQIPNIENAGFKIKKEPAPRKQGYVWTIYPPDDQLTGDFYG